MRLSIWVAAFAAMLTLFSGGYASAQGADECINAEVITITGPGSYVVTIDNTLATDSNPPLPLPTTCPNTALSTVGADVWFSFVPDQDMTFEFNTCDALGFDTDLVLYEGPADCSLLTEVACNGDDATLAGCQGFYSRILGQPLTAGTNYLIRVGGWNGDTGIGNLNVTAVIPSAEICDDGLDNDVDGAIDCFDTDCVGDPACFEGDDITCGDGLDNDADGLIDCVDPDCGGTAPCGIEVCGNGIDDDLDLLVDCFDPDCAGDPTCFEGDDATCADGVDNDADGLIDCFDPDCGGTTPCGLEICDDGVDNDGDGFIDCFDVDCTGDPICFEGDAATCSDGIDNDGDGAIDCVDADCGAFPPCGPEICDDGVDNDGDGLTDCLDDIDCPVGVPGCLAPDNDECATATPINCGDTVTGFTNLATPTTLAECITTNGTGGAVYYVHTGTGVTTSATTCSNTAQYDTKISVYEGDCLTALCVDGNDDNCATGSSGLLSTVTWTATAGIDYIIVVHGFGAGQGLYELTVNCAVASEICDNGIDDDLDGAIDCLDADCAGVPICFEGDDATCSDGIDNDTDGLVDCLDPDCGGTAVCGTEICDNGIDDDGDTLADCLDADCIGTPNCCIVDADECCTALPLVAGGNLIDTTGLTDSANPADCPGGTFFGAMSTDGWYTYTAGFDGLIEWTTCDPAGFDTDVEWFSGDCASLTQVDCQGDGVADPNCQAFHSDGSFLSTAGETYYVRVGGFGAGTAGQVTLTINDFCGDAITGLTGSHDCATDEVFLTWVDAGYDNYDVSRDGVVIASGLPAGTVSYSDLGLANGSYLYTVTGICAGGVAGNLANITVTVSCASGGETDLIVVTENLAGAGLVDSGAALSAALTANGIGFLSVADFPSNLVGNVIGTYDRVWIMSGTFPDDGRMTTADLDAMGAWVEAGVNVYFEGGDNWGFNPPGGSFDNYDGVLSATDGDDTFTSMDGLDTLLVDGGGNPVNWSDLVGVAYNQDAAGNDWTDQLTVGPEAGGPNVGAIWAQAGGAYFTGAYSQNEDLGGSPIGNVLVQSWEFGGYGGDQTDLAARMLAAFGGGGGPSLPEFVRGDCNADGGFNIADAIFLLASLFSGGPAGTCSDACDANDDGGVNIADAIFSLAALFSGGPAPTPTSCGVDPTDTDVLDCVSFPPCP